MRSYLPVALSVLVIIFIDFYTFKGIMFLIARKRSVFIKWFVPIIFFTTSLFFIITQIWLFSSPTVISGPGQYTVVFSIIGLFILFYIPKLVFFIFHLLEDIIWIILILFHRIKNRIKPSKKIFIHSRKRGISVLSKTGALISIILFIAILYGMLFGRFNYKVESEIVYFKDLPSSFNGIKIAQISDLHLGSMENSKNKIARAVEIINSLEPDFVFFTGDMINTYASELDGWIPVLSKIEAKIGKYSIMGNHDYGDYVIWETESLRNKNIEQLKEFHQLTGFELLENESVRINVDSQHIIIAGVESWGEPPFPQKGDIAKALSGTTTDEFKILLSHDPSHWEAKVLPETDINITFSGHTHGGQFGINLPWFKWSPIKYKYPHWSGLYNEGDKYLYVNTGLGYVAFPGRVGIRPEITLLELRKKKVLRAP